MTHARHDRSPRGNCEACDQEKILDLTQKLSSALSDGRVQEFRRWEEAFAKLNYHDLQVGISPAENLKLFALWWVNADFQRLTEKLRQAELQVGDLRDALDWALPLLVDRRGSLSAEDVELLKKYHTLACSTVIENRDRPSLETMRAAKKFMEGFVEKRVEDDPPEPPCDHKQTESEQCIVCRDCGERLV